MLGESVLRIGTGLQLFANGDGYLIVAVAIHMTTNNFTLLTNVSDTNCLTENQQMELVVCQSVYKTFNKLLPIGKFGKEKERCLNSSHSFNATWRFIDLDCQRNLIIFESLLTTLEASITLVASSWGDIENQLELKPNHHSQV